MFPKRITPTSFTRNTVTGSPMSGQWPSSSRCSPYPDMFPSSSWMMCTWGCASSRWALASSNFQASKPQETPARTETSTTSLCTERCTGVWFPTAATNRPLIARPLHTMLLKLSLFINSSLCIDQGRINPFLNINRDPVKIKLGSLTSLNHLSLSHLLYRTLRTLRPLLDPNLPLNRRPLLNPNVPLILSPPFSTKPPLNRNPPLALSHLLNPNLLFKLLPLLNRSPPLN